MTQNDDEVGNNFFSADFSNFWDSLTLSLRKGFHKQKLFNSYVTAFFILSSFRNTYVMGLISDWKCSKFNVDSKTTIKEQQNIFGFLDNCIWIALAINSLYKNENLVICSKRIKGTFHKSIFFQRSIFYLALCRYLFKICYYKYEPAITEAATHRCAAN